MCVLPGRKPLIQILAMWLFCYTSIHFVTIFQMASFKEKVREWFKPRENTDLQAEILNIIAAPIYVYTITCVYIYGMTMLIPYFYNESCALMQTFQYSISTLIYIEMMSNWLCIVLVNNSVKKNQTWNTSKQLTEEYGTANSLNSVVVEKGKKLSMRERRENGVIPGPKSTPVQEIKLSYWSWKPCLKCQLNTPPRCHHCPMCNVCVLKRDHHCFFTRRCVGFFNQRHFIVFCAWASFGTTYATIHFLLYYCKVLMHQSSAWDVFAPFALLRWIFGDGTFAITNIMLTFTFNFLFIFLSTGFIIDQIQLIREGLTQFEQKSVDRNKLRIVDPRRFQDKLQAVFGHNYGISLIVPFAHVFFPPHENPFEWPEVKIYRGKIR